MNAVTKALSEIFFRVPREILQVVFVDPYREYRNLAPDIQERIHFLVLQQRVLVDCNLVSGPEVRVDLSDLRSESVDGGYTSVFQIPKTKTNGRSILSVLDVTYGDLYNTQSGYGVYSYSRTSPALQVASTVMEAQLRTPYVGSARVDLIGENVIMVQDSIILPQNLYLRCLVEHDENMNSLNARSYLAFAKLVELAVKAYIYNSYVIQLDMGELRGGIQIGKFKEIVESYASSEDMYQDYLREKWTKIAFMNDSESFRRFGSLLAGGSR